MRDALERFFHRLKEKRWTRITGGILLLLGGVLGPILPILGIWMIPLGLVLLAVDFPWAQRLNDQLQDWWQRMKTKYKRR